MSVDEVRASLLTPGLAPYPMGSYPIARMQVAPPADAQPDPNDGATEPPPREDAFNVEARQLAIPYDDPSDSRTISTVLGVRSVHSIDATRIEIRMGPSFNVPEAGDPQGYQIYSPDDPNYALERLVEPTSVALHSDPDVAPAVPDSDGRAFEQHIITLTVPHALVSGAQYFVRAIGGRRAPQDPMNHHRVPWEGYPLTAGRNAGQFVHGEDPMTISLMMPSSTR